MCETTHIGVVPRFLLSQFQGGRLFLLPPQDHFSSLAALSRDDINVLKGAIHVGIVELLEVVLHKTVAAAERVTHGHEAALAAPRAELARVHALAHVRAHVVRALEWEEEEIGEKEKVKERERESVCVCVCA